MIDKLDLIYKRTEKINNYFEKLDNYMFMALDSDWERKIMVIEIKQSYLKKSSKKELTIK